MLQEKPESGILSGNLVWLGGPMASVRIFLLRIIVLLQVSKYTSLGQVIKSSYYFSFTLALLGYNY